MRDIFDNATELQLFCYEIIETWIETRERKGLVSTREFFTQWLYDDLILDLAVSYDKVVEKLRANGRSCPYCGAKMEYEGLAPEKQNKPVVGFVCGRYHPPGPGEE